MKIKDDTFNCENLFSRYRFFLCKTRKKKRNIYNKKYLSVSDIPTTLVESFVKDTVLETLYEYPGFLPKEVISRKDGNKVTKSNLQTLAKSGESRLFDFKIPSITKIYPKVTKKNVGNKDQNLKNLLDYRVVALQVQKEMDKIEMEGGLLNSAERNLSYKGFAKNQRWNTAKVILANDPDILALQEIKNLDTPKAFNKKYLYPRNLKRELKKRIQFTKF